MPGRAVSIRARALSRGVFRDDVVAHTVTFDDASEVTERAIRGAVLERTHDDGRRARLMLDDIVVTHRGRVLRDVDDVIDTAVDGDDGGAAVLVAVKPRARGRDAAAAAARDSGAAARRRRERRRRRIVNGVIVDEDDNDDDEYADGGDEGDENDADLCEPLRGMRARVERTLTARLGVSRWIANLIARAPLFRVILWLFGLRLARTYDVGPIYILCTGFVLIFTNLGGARRKGELSAYSVFNPGARALPGQLMAEDFDDAILHRNRRDD